jgi:hypothetical protein
MAGDLRVRERAVLEGVTPRAAAAPPGRTPERAIHRYGRLSILAQPEAAAPAAAPPDDHALWNSMRDLAETERLGLAALWLRDSAGYRYAKHSRPRAGEPWDMPSCTTVVPTPRARARAVGALAAGPTSA